MLNGDQILTGQYLQYKMSKNTCNNIRKEGDVPSNGKKLEYASKVKAKNNKPTSPKANTPKGDDSKEKVTKIETNDNGEDQDKIKAAEDTTDNNEEVKSPGKRSFIEAPVPSTNAWKSKHNERYLKLSSKPQKTDNKPSKSHALLYTTTKYLINK